MANRTSHGIRIAEYWLLAAVLVVFACLSFFYTSSVPPFEGPDEPEHFAYILWVAEGRGFPPQGEAAWETPVRQESGQPPFYYWLASLPLRLVDVEAPTAEYRPNPHFPSSAPGHIPDNKNIAIHYPDDDTLQGGWLALRLARGVSFLFGVLLIVSVYLLARELFPERRFLAVASAALTAVIPQVLFISNVASNDIPAAAMGTLTLWLMVQLLQRGPTFRDGFTLGLAFGLSALSKTGNLALALPVAAGFAWLFWQKNEVRPQLLKAAVAAVVAALLAGGWWYLRSWVLYGSPFGLDAHYLAPWALSAESAPLNPVAQWQEVFYSFWAAFGWGNIKFQALLYLPIVVLTLVAVLVPVFIIRKNWPGWQNLPVWSFVLPLAIVGVAAALAFWMQQVTAPHGRLLFPAIGAITILLVLGWEKLGRSLTYTALSYLFFFACISLILLIRPAYALPDFLPANDVPGANSAQLNWDFGSFARLVSVTPAAPSAAAGETLPVTTCWETMGQVDEDYTIFVQLVGPENQVAAGRRTYPGLGSYPTSTWEPGHYFCDDVRVDIPADLGRTLQYQVEVGFISQTGERVAAVESDGRPRDHLFASTVRLETAEPAQLAQTPPGNDLIRLADADFNPQWQIGESEIVTLRWWLGDAVDKDYTVFVHLRDMQSGENATQGDGPPVGGWYPTSLWEVGEVVEDEHEVELTAEITPGTYNLVVGWYDPLSGERLGSEVLLGMVEVVP